jgi:hypothetical protein
MQSIWPAKESTPSAKRLAEQVKTGVFLGEFDPFRHISGWREGVASRENA